MQRHLVWFRRDLRLRDNQALCAANQRGVQTLAVYINSPGQDRRHNLGQRQQQFIQQNLQCLRRDLETTGIELHTLHCDTFNQTPSLLGEFIAQQQVQCLFANREFGINEEQRDQQVKQRIDIDFKRFDSDCIIPAGRVLTQSGEMFRVFTAFRNAWINQLLDQGYHLHNLPELPDPISEPEHSQGLMHWPPGEASALQRLDEFCQDDLSAYADQRDFPALAGTSRLSPYLSTGVISAKQCLQQIESTLGYLPHSPGEKGFAWLNELVWREFYRHLMHAYPELSKNSCFKPSMNQLTWIQDERLFESWCEGKTGYPIVDAAMRCLNQTGWMHNRLRMIVASFLTKDLQIDWRWGERYFMQQLIDADFASNNGGWQWAAGTGADAAPYFRIFNPTLQGEKFDRQGEFIRQWVPELETVPERYIHNPHKWFKSRNIASSYPEPVVDHATARKQTLQRYQQI